MNLEAADILFIGHILSLLAIHWFMFDVSRKFSFFLEFSIYQWTFINGRAGRGRGRQIQKSLWPGGHMWLCFKSGPNPLHHAAVSTIPRAQSSPRDLSNTPRGLRSRTYIPPLTLSSDQSASTHRRSTTQTTKTASWSQTDIV